MTKRYRLIFLLLSLIVLVTIGRVINGSFGFLISQYWFTSGLLLLILLSLIDQPHFSKDANIFVNAITAGMSLLIVPQLERNWVWRTFFTVCMYLIISSYLLIWLRTRELDNEKWFIKFTSRLNRQIGRPEALFSAFFIWGGVKQFGFTGKFNSLLLFWIIFMILNIPSIASLLSSLIDSFKEKKVDNGIGQIFGVQAKNTFLVKLFEKRPSTKIFDFVEFRYSMDENKAVRKGLVLDNYLLNQEQWIKILVIEEINKIFENKIYNECKEVNIVYKIDCPEATNYLERFVGIIDENSTISKIRFVYNSKKEISEGQLLEVYILGNKVLYQIVQGVTKIEQLEQKNETGYIIGEAYQIGVWNSEKQQFEKYGWVPNVNSPVYLASPIKEPPIKPDEYKIGYIPNTNYPVVLNKVTAITHHTAILGITGCGKSVFTRNLIREILKCIKTKVICVDFTLEYKDKFEDLKPQNVVSNEKSKELFSALEFISTELEKFGNQQDKKRLKEANELIFSIFKESIETFIKSDSKIVIFELPDVMNTIAILEYTKHFFRTLFEIAKKEKCFGNRICVVLEEAHTVIPEWNFIGISEKNSQSLVNSIGQIALQGRKYDIGFIVVAQRTANVSKTILTQCNSVIAFQEFDKTSSDFLANYFGETIVETLPNLRFRQAIAAGKALRSNVPVIFEVPFINEK